MGPLKEIDASLHDLMEIIHFTESVSTKIHGLLDEAQIYRTIREESAKSEEYIMSILLLTEDRTRLKIAETALPLKRVRAAEKATGILLREFTIDLEKDTSYKRVVKGGETIHVRIHDVVSELLPRPIAYVLSTMFDYKKKFSILTPLERHGEVIGILAIASPVLANYFIPSVKSLAQHISAALELSDEYKERKLMEEALRKSEEKFRGIAERSFDALYEIDLEGATLYASPAIERITGYTPEEVQGASIFDYVPESQRARILSLMEDVLKGELRGGQEVDLVRKDGSLATVEINYSFVFKEGKPVGFQGVLRDISERKKTQEELQKYRLHLENLVEERTVALTAANQALEKEILERKAIEESLAAEKEQLAVTLRSIGDGVITTDTDGIVVLINKVAESLTGWTQEEAVGKPLQSVFRIVNEKTRLSVENPVDKVMRRGVVVGLGNDTLLIARDGTERVIADSGSPIRDKNSTIVGVVLVFRDITEKQKMEEDISRTQKLEALGNLAGGIAHDFNNVLTAILSNANLAKMYTDDEKVVEKLVTIEKASLQAKNLTQQLLTFSRGGSPIKKVTSMKELIMDSARFALRGSNVRCECDIADDLWSADVDEGQISQVINNIVMNADEAMPEGGIIRITAENAYVGKDVLPLGGGRYVKISIADKGVGIARNYLSKIFDPYFTTKQKGSGLGLSTCYSIIKRHDGYIDVESEIGVGTTFAVYIPGSQEEREEKRKRTELLKGEGKVLVMDDEEVIRDAATEVLQYLGYVVATAKDGEEAFDMYREAYEKGECFDVVIMDLTVPGGMGGKEAVVRLKEINPSVKVIVSSGYSTDPVMADHKEHGFCGVVTKPYSVEDLSSALRKVME
ncbi:MAG: PAS domain S-box protein [Theionarchaea archaeon]|nr:PAS domain S-box protein [Theionarchaea archaeon]